MSKLSNSCQQDGLWPNPYPIAMKHLERDLDSLKQRTLELGEHVTDAVTLATRALFERNQDLAREASERERQIDQLEVALEEECLKVLALHQPVARNLRLVITALKVDNDLERMGDAADSIAARATRLATLPPIPVPARLEQMVQSAKGMVKKALTALVREDARLARQVLEDDAIVDNCQRSMFHDLQAQMRESPELVDVCVMMLSATRQIERIADLATNIAEDVIFLLEGEIVRHKRLDPSEPVPQ